ncbi:MAG TPA: Ig-like domain-containing protein [Gemmatimonadales bacterium]|nr:Ig-like domain-containing protein [Gemmatimonadales bacterium]
MPAPTVAPVPPKGGALKWIGLAAALVVIGVGAWAMFGREKGNPPAPAPAAGTPAAPPAPVASITVIPSSTALVVGDTAQLAAVLMDASRNILASVGHTVLWKSADSTKARISSTGLVQARAPGRVDVIATIEGKSDTGSVVITTVAAPVATVEVAGPKSIASGDTAALTVSPKDAQGNVLTGRTVTWGSSDRTIATVSAGGTVTALRLGTVTITALVEKKAGSARLTVTPVAVASVTISPPEAALQIGARTQLAATPRDARDRVLTGRPVRWSSSANAIATVTPTGVVTGVAAGQTTITAQIESQSAQATVSVALVPVASVTLTPATLTLAIGKSSQIAVALKDARGNTIRDRDVTWTTSDPSIVGVSPTGLVTATRGGTATITAASENARATVAVTVPAPAAPPVVANNPGPESQPAAVTPPPVQPPTNPPPEAARVTARRGVTAGGQHTCALTTGGAVACWGSNDLGQMGDPSAGAATNVPILVSGVSSATLLTAGNNHTCALADGSAMCWGANLKGQLGNGRTASSSTPVAVTGGHAFQSIVAGARHTCGLGTDGVAWCWGDNDNGQLGNGTTHGNATPQRVGGATRFRMLAAGSDHTCGLASDGRVYCWGDGFSGQLGRGARESTTEPNPVDGDVKFSSVAAAGKHACALALNGKAYCWGANVAGEIGDGSKSERDSPVPVTGAHSFTALTAGFEHTCGLTADGDAYCWGRNREGQIGDGTRVDKQAPVKVAYGPPLQTVGAGGNHTCGVTSSGVVCWGGNIKGQLGDASVTARLTPVSVESGH